MQYRFANCVFDDARRHFSRGGREVDLSPRAHKALAVLLQRHPNPVSKQDLYEALWPDTYVELTNLNNVIAELRAAMGDAGKRVLKTKHRFGYVLSAPVATESADASFVFLIGTTTFHLRDGENVVGRTPDAAVVINSPAVSRRHAIIHISGSDISIEDLGSKNGTSVDGAAVVNRHALRDGSTVCFGSVCGVLHNLRGTSTVTELP